MSVDTHNREGGTMRQRAMVMLTGRALADLCFGGHGEPGPWHRVSRGIPKDAIYMGMHHDYMRDAVYLVFEHESFKRVPEGEMCPVVNNYELERMPANMFFVEFNPASGAPLNYDYGSVKVADLTINGISEWRTLTNADASPPSMPTATPVAHGGPEPAAESEGDAMMRFFRGK